MSSDALHRIKALESQLQNAIQEIVKLQVRLEALEAQKEAPRTAPDAPKAVPEAPRHTITLKK